MNKITRIGHTGRAFRIEAHLPDGTMTNFDIRTSSTRRFLVLDIPSRTTFMRTDNAKTAARARTASPSRRLTLDTVTAGFVF